MWWLQVWLSCSHIQKGGRDLSWQLPRQRGRGKLWPAHSSTASNRSDDSREHRAAITGHCVSGMSRCAAGTEGHAPFHRKTEVCNKWI